MRAAAGDRLAAPVQAAAADRRTPWLPAMLQRHASAVAEARAAGHKLVAVRYLPNADCFFLGDDPLALLRSVPDLVGLDIRPREPWRLDAFDPFVCNLVLEALSTAPPDTVRPVFRLVPDQVAIVELAAEAAAPVSAGGEAGARALRVDAARIDALVDIVGELIVIKNSMAHLAARAAGADRGLARELGASQAELDRLVGDMHRAIMRVRMTPLAGTFRRFPRAVREIADRLGKQVTFEVQGADIEADKTIVDGLFEPLLHVLRNAVDHGIEAPEVRYSQGKPEAGHVVLAGRRDGDRIVIAVSDDGAGIDLDRVRRAARTRKLMTDTALDALDDEAVAGLIFAPGLSTAASVTAVSGRGVGMDAVRIAVEALGGRVGLTSTRGAGATVSLTLPQAALVSAVIMVRVGEERFGIPIDTIAETARVPLEHIVPFGGGEAFVLRDRTIPLLRLSELLGLEGARRPARARVLVVLCGDQLVGVEVDDFAERIDVLLRPLSGLLAGAPGVLGAAILGDGRVLMVLDVPALIG